MKKIHLTAIGVLILFIQFLFFAKHDEIDIQKLVANKGVEIFNRELSLFQ